MTDEIHAYPLAWPDGWPRHEVREHAQFHRKTERYRRVDRTINESCRAILVELERMGVNEWDVIVSTDAKTNRSTGLPYGSAKNPTDPGAAVYFKSDGRHVVIALDKYIRLADNLYAIAKTLEAMRAIERWGGGQLLDRTFTAFQRLDSPDSWRAILSLPPDATLEDATAQYRKLVQQHHPDRGGDAEAFHQTQQAYSKAKAELGA